MKYIDLVREVNEVAAKIYQLDLWDKLNNIEVYFIPHKENYIVTDFKPYKNELKMYLPVEKIKGISFNEDELIKEGNSSIR